VNRGRVSALTRRIVAQFRRDPRTLALIFIVPLAILLLLGWILGGQQATTTYLAIVNEDGQAGAAVASSLASSATQAGLHVVSEPDESAARTAISNGTVDIAVVLPADIGTQLQTRQPPTVTVITAGVNPAQEAGYVAQVQRSVVAAFGNLAPAGLQLPTVERTTVFGAPDAGTIDTLAPVEIGFFAYFFVFILTGISFLRERIGGTLERLLGTPITRGEIVAGYSLGFGIFATIEVVLILVFTLMEIDTPGIGPLPPLVIGLGVPSAGNPALAFLIALVLVLGAVSLGIFLSTFARTELQVLQFIPLVIVPQALLAGIFWPIASLPPLLQAIAHLMPLTYAVDGLRDVIIKGYGLGDPGVQLDLAVLVGVAVFFAALAAATIRREVA
jgi:ABC-2 type transport system permease protein